MRSAPVQSTCRADVMRVSTLLIALGFAALCGCAAHDDLHFEAGRGNPAEFILEQAIARGAKVESTNDLPVIHSGWKYGEDQHGVVVRLPRSDGAAVEKVLRRAFGAPTYGPQETPSGGRWAAYRLPSSEISIQFISDEQGTEVDMVHWIAGKSERP